MSQAQTTRPPSPTTTTAATKLAGAARSGNPLDAKLRGAANYAEGAALVCPASALGYDAAKRDTQPLAKDGAKPAPLALPFEAKGSRSLLDKKAKETKGTQMAGGDSRLSKKARAAGPSLPKIAGVDPTGKMLEGATTERGGGSYLQQWAADQGPHGLEIGAESGKKKKGRDLSVQGTLYAAGAGTRLGVKGKASTEGAYGSAATGADAALLAQAGLESKAKASRKDGLEISGSAEAKAGLEASASAEANSPKFLGTDAGVGANANAFVGARLGATVKAAMSKEFKGVQGSIGGFAGIEAKAEANAHVGPVGAKLQGSLQAGVGASLEGEISYSKGKIRVSAKGAAALGIGASLGGSVELDIGEAIAMGGELARFAMNSADVDGDGQMGLGDVAHAGKGIVAKASKAYNATADRAGRAWDGLTSMMP